MKEYSPDFYASRDTSTRHAAERVLGLVRQLIPPVNSAVDVGCGVGSWLHVLGQRGTPTLVGLDGDWVDRNQLLIPPGSFVPVDLAREVTVEGGDPRLRARYDLVISLEVAEHLPPERAAAFVSLLTRLGDFVLFSAAVPGQGGVNHLNERLPDYWVHLFERHGYAVVDAIRPRIWSDAGMGVHYRQNALLFVKRDRMADVKVPAPVPLPLSVIHPQLYLSILHDLRRPTILQALAGLGRAIRQRFRRGPGRPGPDEADPA